VQRALMQSISIGSQHPATLCHASSAGHARSACDLNDKKTSSKPPPNTAIAPASPRTMDIIDRRRETTREIELLDHAKTIQSGTGVQSW